MTVDEIREQNKISNNPEIEFLLTKLDHAHEALGMIAGMSTIPELFPEAKSFDELVTKSAMIIARAIIDPEAPPWETLFDSSAD